MEFIGQRAAKRSALWEQYRKCLCNSTLQKHDICTSVFQSHYSEKHGKFHNHLQKNLTFPLKFQALRTLKVIDCHFGKSNYLFS